jgi:hypothetical protein
MNLQPVPVAARSKAWVCGRSPAEIVGSNTTGGMDVLSVVSVVCCQIEVSATSWSLVQRSPTDCGGRCVWSRNHVNGEALTHGRLLRPKKMNHQVPSNVDNFLTSRVIYCFSRRKVSQGVTRMYEQYDGSRTKWSSCAQSTESDCVVCSWTWYLFALGKADPPFLWPATYVFQFFYMWDNAVNPLNPELNPICYLLALLGAHRFLHVSRIRVKSLTFRLLMSYIYIHIWSTHSWCF